MRRMPATFWMKVDNWSHHPVPRRALPRKIRSWICDRLDLAFGLNEDEL
jgi:hypothetical protein